MTDVIENAQRPAGHARVAAAGESGAKKSGRRAVRLLGIGTATPAAALQNQTMALAEEFSCQSDGQRAWLRRVFSRAGVEERGSVLMAGGMEMARAFYGAPAVAGEHGPSTAMRMERYIREAPALGEAACRAAFGEAGIEPARVTHLISVSCTGFHAPGLDVELISRLGLRRDVQRLHLGFMGCHAAFNALAAARDAVGADPQAVVLVCCVELCTLHFAYGWNPEKLVANALFADGASACVVAADRDAGDGTGQWRLRETASFLLPESREAMTWRIGDHGFEMTLSAELPALIRGHLREWCERWLGAAGMKVADVRRWAIHPGGPKILAAAMEALGLEERDVAASRRVLAKRGNMSSATVMFLLKELEREGGEGPCVAIGFGPGLMAEGMLLE